MQTMGSRKQWWLETATKCHPDDTEWKVVGKPTKPSVADDSFDYCDSSHNEKIRTTLEENLASDDECLASSQHFLSGSSAYTISGTEMSDMLLDIMQGIFPSLSESENVHDDVPLVDVPKEPMYDEPCMSTMDALRNKRHETLCIPQQSEVDAELLVAHNTSLRQRSTSCTSSMATSASTLVTDASHTSSESEITFWEKFGRDFVYIASSKQRANIVREKAD